MTVFWARDGFYCAYAIGTTDLTAWDNGQLALEVGELNAIDWFYAANITHTKPRTINANPMTAGHYPKRIQVGRIPGRLSTTHYLQTGILTYAVMGACTSTIVSDPYTHTITKATDESPIRLAFHYEKEGTSASRRKDLMGFVPRELNIRVSERDPIAYQTYSGDFAFTGAGADLAQPTPFTQLNLPPYTWFDTKHASAGTLFQYNSGDINVDIVDVSIRFGWTGSLFGSYDSSGYPTNGLQQPPFIGEVSLGVRLTDYTDTVLDTIADLVHTSYAGNLVYVLDFYKSANDYLKYTFTDMYIDPESYEEVFQSEGDWFNGCRFTLKFRDETSTLAVETKDNLTKTQYEND